MALVAGMRNVLAGSVAARTGLLNLEEAGAGADITAAVTGRAGFYLRALFCTGSAAGCALAPGGNLNLCLIAFCGLFKRDIEVINQIFTAEHLLILSGAAGVSSAENLGENIAHIAELRCIKTSEPAESAGTGAAGAAVECRTAVAVICRTLLLVLQHFIGFAYLFEFFFGMLVPFVAVRVILHRHAAITFLDLFLSSSTGDSQYLVIIKIFFVSHSLRNSVIG